MTTTSTYANLRRRGDMLKRQLTEIIDGTAATPPTRPSVPVSSSPSSRHRARRESLVRHARSGCGEFFQHPAAFARDGIRVATRVHSSAVARSCVEFFVDTLNDMKYHGVIAAATSDYIRFARVSVIRGPSRQTTHGTVRLYGPRPHTEPDRVHHAVIGTRTPSLTLPIADLRAGRLTHIPVFLTVDVMRLDRWEVVDDVPEMTAQTRLTRERYPRLAAALAAATRGGSEVRHVHGTDALEVPVFGAHAWMQVDGHRWAMQIDPSYRHAIALVFTSSGDAVVIDSNAARPEYADAMLARWVESLGFAYRVATLPGINQEDSNRMTRVLSRLDINTPMTITGYCTSITLAYLIDVLCTDRYDDGHLARFLADLVPPDADDVLTQACVILYARAVAHDCLRLCLLRLRNGVAVPRAWPTAAVPIAVDPSTSRITWKQVTRALG